MTDNQAAVELCKRHHLRVEFGEKEIEIERYADVCGDDCGGRHHRYEWILAGRGTDFLETVRRAIAT